RRVLEAFSPYWDGYHLYYASRRQSSPAFVALVDALRHRA
ncbi:LysR family transcriptional regulator, partial [Rhizobium ruizarguesonis]